MAKKQRKENKNPTITKNTYGEKKTHSTGGKKSTVGETAARIAYEGGQSQFREGHLVGMLPGWILVGF